LITQQILKQMTQHEHAEIYFMLAYASVSKGDIALTRHWLNKYIKTGDFNLQMLQQHPAFKALQQENWFKQLVQSKLH